MKDQINQCIYAVWTGPSLSSWAVRDLNHFSLLKQILPIHSENKQRRNSDIKQGPYFWQKFIKLVHFPINSKASIMLSWVGHGLGLHTLKKKKEEEKKLLWNRIWLLLCSQRNGLKARKAVLLTFAPQGHFGWNKQKLMLISGNSGWYIRVIFAVGNQKQFIKSFFFFFFFHFFSTLRHDLQHPFI